MNNSTAGISLVEASTPRHVAAVRQLFLEYADSLGFSLCFQSFDNEIAGLPGDYAAPAGRLLLAFDCDRAIGCVALHAIDEHTAEMKRLYVRPEGRGRGLGRMLVERVLAEARTTGYRRVRLDTVEPKMQTAVKLYRAMGFCEISPYRENPIPGALYMEFRLNNPGEPQT